MISTNRIHFPALLIVALIAFVAGVTSAHSRLFRFMKTEHPTGGPVGERGGSLARGAAGPQAALDRFRTYTGDSRIRGRVVDAAGLAVRYARVEAIGGALGDSRATAISDALGHYELRLAAGTYRVSASKKGFAGFDVDRLGHAFVTTTVSVPDRGAADNVDVVLPRGGSIRGRVIDGFGDPVAYAAMNVYQYDDASGRPVLRLVAPIREPIRTDDRGDYRIYGLPSGDYLVSATVGDDLTGVDGAGQPLAFAPTFFPSTDSEELAIQISVEADKDKRADITLTTARQITVAGRVVSASKRPAAGGVVTLSKVGFEQASSMTAPIGPDGTFSMSALLRSGTHVLRAVSGVLGGPVAQRTLEFGTSQPFDLRAIPEGITVVTQSGATLAGRVVTDAPAGLPRVRIVAVPVGISRDALPQAVAVPVDASGRFELRNVFGRSTVRADFPEDNWTLASVVAGDDDLTQSGIEVSPGGRRDDINVTVSNRAATVRGRVITDRTSARECVVVAMAEGADGEHTQILTPNRITRATGDGDYLLRGLDAGHYSIGAFGVMESAPLEHIASKSRLRTLGTRVELGRGDDLRLDMPCNASK